MKTNWTKKKEQDEPEHNDGLADEAANMAGDAAGMAEGAANHDDNDEVVQENNEEHVDGDKAAHDAQDEDAGPIISDDDADEPSNIAGVDNSNTDDESFENTPGVGEPDPPETTGVGHDHVRGLAEPDCYSLGTANKTLEEEMDQKYGPAATEAMGLQSFTCGPRTHRIHPIQREERFEDFRRGRGASSGERDAAAPRSGCHTT
jgi:hypothetical protein